MTRPDENLRALAAEYYISPEVFAEEREKLFFKSWQYACHVSELAEPGDYVSSSILGQNFFVVRDQDHEIRAYYNICPHRGHELVEGAGQSRAIVRPYHHWSFSLDGSLRHMRKRDTSAVPAQKEVCLKIVRVDRLLDFIFVNLDPGALPIAEFWPGIEKQVREKCPKVDSYVLGETAAAIHEVDVAANWKIQIDNYLECQHCRHGHISFLLSVQEGMNQRCFDQGWYIVDWENIEYSEAMMRHFHNTYLEHMGRSSPATAQVAE